MHNISILADDESYKKEVEAFIVEWHDEREYITINTSGSTGKPKSIHLQKDKMRVSALATGRFFGFTPKWHLCSPLPVQYIAGKMMIVRALEWNLSLDIIEPSANPLNDLSHRYDFMVMTPHQLMTGLQSKYSDNIHHIDTLLLGGSPVNIKLQTTIQKLKTSVFIGYGMTETMSHVALRSLNGKNKSDYYTAVENVRFDVDNRDCLIITSQKLLKEPLITNDVVTLKSNTEFQWLGRYDQVINTGGIKVFPLEVENKIRPFFSVPFYISHKKHNTLGQQVIIRINDKAWDKTTEKALIEKMRDVLATYELPKQIIFEDQFQYTKNGKLIRL